MDRIDMMMGKLREMEALIDRTGRAVTAARKEVLTVDEAVEYTGLKRSYIYKMCSERAIPHYKSKGGKATYFRRSELDEWMMATRVSTVEEVERKAARMVYAI